MTRAVLADAELVAFGIVHHDPAAAMLAFDLRAGSDRADTR